MNNVVSVVVSEKDHALFLFNSIGKRVGSPIPALCRLSFAKLENFSQTCKFLPSAILYWVKSASG
jgi:hypothetical protein